MSGEHCHLTLEAIVILSLSPYPYTVAKRKGSGI